RPRIPSPLRMRMALTTMHSDMHDDAFRVRPPTGRPLPRNTSFTLRRLQAGGLRVTPRRDPDDDDGDGDDGDGSHDTPPFTGRSNGRSVRCFMLIRGHRMQFAGAWFTIGLKRLASGRIVRTAQQGAPAGNGRRRTNKQ